MKLAVIGAGISGLTISRLLKQNCNEIVIFEKNELPGGIARTRDVNGIAYHVAGGHCFNSKHKDVLDFVFNEVMPEEKWHEVQRVAQIYFKGKYISYPIEYAIKEIAEFDLDLACHMVNDFYASDKEDRSNLANWFKSKFGKSLADEYFIPYNEKIWNRSAVEMSPDWVEDKLPIPNKHEFTKALLIGNKDNMPHSTFYYPNTNDQNTFIDNLAFGANINFNYEVNAIKRKGCKWIINNEFEFDYIINTIPLNIFPKLIEGCPEDVINDANRLRYNKVSNMLWKTKGNNDTWTYYPNKDTIFHRHIHIGNFFDAKKNASITEAIGVHSFEEMKKEGEKYDYLIEPLDWHISDHAYVVFDNNYKPSRDHIFKYLESVGIYTLGRFGEWEYYNMDICIKSAIKLASRIQKDCT